MIHATHNGNGRIAPAQEPFPESAVDEYWAMKEREVAEAARGTRPLSAGELSERYPELRRVVIERIAREGETVNIIAASKMHKSFLVDHAALAIATGRPLLDTFNTSGGRVLIIDNELHPETMAYRLRKVAESMGLAYADWADVVDVFPLRGRIRNLIELAPLFASIEPRVYDAIFLDAWYRLTPPSPGGENDNAAATLAYNTLDGYANRLRCVFINVHHSSKGAQGDKRTTDVGSGAGAMSRAADAHLIIREHEEYGCAVLDGVVRSFEPFVPLGIRWTFPQWTIDPLLDVTHIKRESRAGRPRAGEGKPKAEKPEPYTAERFAAEFITDAAVDQAIIVALATEGKRMSAREADRLLKLAEHRGAIHRHHRGGTDKRIYFANRPQELLETGDAQSSLTRAHSPRTPLGRAGDKSRRPGK
jgi:hypothetical protein